MAKALVAQLKSSIALLL